MVIYFGADHRGFELKERLKNLVRDQGYEVIDAGAPSYTEGDDYAVYAIAVAKKISLDPVIGRGVLVCGSGAGVDIVANKFKRVRSAVGLSPDQVYAARRDDDVNVLSIAADFTSREDAEKMMGVFLATLFSGEERHRRRLEEIEQIEIAKN